MSEITDIKKRLLKIEERNRRVELDKTWETSWVRRLSIVVLTYVFIGLYLTFIGTQNPWINAIVPVFGFIFSTLSLNIIKNYWTKNR